MKTETLKKIAKVAGIVGMVGGGVGMIGSAINFFKPDTVELPQSHIEAMKKIASEAVTEASKAATKS